MCLWASQNCTRCRRPFGQERQTSCGTAHAFEDVLCTHVARVPKLSPQTCPACTTYMHAYNRSYLPIRKAKRREAKEAARVAARAAAALVPAQPTLAQLLSGHFQTATQQTQSTAVVRAVPSFPLQNMPPVQAIPTKQPKSVKMTKPTPRCEQQTRRSAPSLFGPVTIINQQPQAVAQSQQQQQASQTMTHPSPRAPFGYGPWMNPTQP